MTIVPASPEELAQCLAEANSRKQQIALLGNSSKARMGGPIEPCDIAISTAGLNKVLEYEPRDLTISVGAGITYCELSRVLAEHRQMIPLDPPFSDQATMGGIIAANTSGPRRRLYGSARDMAIGMTFATLEGKLIRTGGMVVKNVAGLDMGKLMIGSFGTLAAIATLNFKLLPIPTVYRTLLFPFEDLKAAAALYEAVMKANLNPVAADVLNPILSAQFSLKHFIVALQFGGNQAVIERSVREAMALAPYPETERGLSSNEES